MANVHNPALTTGFQPDGTLGQRRVSRIRNAAALGLVSKFIGFACNLALVPILLSSLGRVDFGIWAAYQSLQGILVFADFGIGNGMQNRLSVALAQNDLRAAQRLVSSAAVALTGAATVLAVLLALGWIVSLSQPWAAFFPTHEVLPASVQSGVIVFAVAGLLAIPLSCGERTAIALQASAVGHAARAVAVPVSCGVIFILARNNAGFPWICMASSLPVIVAPLLTWLAVAWRHSWARPSLLCVSPADVSSILRSGLGFLAVQSTAIFGFGFDPILLERCAGPQEVADYYVVQRLFSVVTMLTGIALTPLWPAYADARARADLPWIRSTLRFSLAGTVTIAGMLCVAISLFAEKITGVWTNHRISLPQQLVVAFAVWSLALACGSAYSLFWNGMQWLRLQTGLGILFIAASLPAKLLLLPRDGAFNLILINTLAYITLMLIPGTLITLRSLSDMSHTGIRHA